MLASRPLSASIGVSLAFATFAFCNAAGPQPSPARQRIVDPAVVPAGGTGKHCPTGGCRHHGSGHHHAGCRNGICEPSCPVRPGQFGYYGTQWRKWPGTGVVPVSNNAAVTPAQPPRSAVPDVEEESLEPKQPPGALPPPAVDPNAQAPQSAPGDTAPTRDSGDRTADPADTPAEPTPKPMDVKPEPPPEPKSEPKPKPTADDNLFDEARDDRVAPPRPLGRTVGRPTKDQPATEAKPAAWQPVVEPRSVARVPFSPAEESAALRTRIQQLRQR